MTGGWRYPNWTLNEQRSYRVKKVLFVIFSLGYGGAERSLVNLLAELPWDKYQVDLLLFRRHLFPEQLLLPDLLP